MYRELAPWFHLLTAPEDYADEAAFILGLLREQARGPIATLLELGAGGGNVALHLKRHLRLTLTDISADMLAQSEAINPDCEHHVGDMRTLRLGTSFDAVLVHDAIGYLTTEAELAATFATAWEHLRPGGSAVFAPDHVRETFAPATDHGGHDGADGRGLRYLEWTTDPDPTDTTYRVDYAILLREADGTARVQHDRHVEGLFPRSRWLALLAEAGFDARAVDDPWNRLLFAARRPA